MYKTAKMAKLCGFGVVQGLAASLHLASIYRNTHSRKGRKLALNCIVILGLCEIT